MTGRALGGKSARLDTIPVDNQGIARLVIAADGFLGLHVLHPIRMVVQVVLADTEHHSDLGTAVQILELKTGKLQDHQVPACQFLYKTDGRYADIPAHHGPFIRTSAQYFADERHCGTLALGPGHPQDRRRGERKKKPGLAGNLNPLAPSLLQFGPQHGQARSAENQLEPIQFRQVVLPQVPAPDVRAPFLPQGFELFASPAVAHGKTYAPGQQEKSQGPVLHPQAEEGYFLVFELFQHGARHGFYPSLTYSSNRASTRWSNTCSRLTSIPLSLS